MTDTAWHMSVDQGRANLPGPDPEDPTFATVFKTPASEALFYAPRERDLQEPHDRDEYYVVVSGHGTFINGETRHKVKPGDIMFVPAHRPHKFVDFSDDFATWVIFYGPTEDAAYWSDES